MSIFCAMRGHNVAPGTIRNAGVHFGRCTRCRTDLVELEGVWAPAPPGYRVVWKKAVRGPASEVPPPPAPEKVVAAQDRRAGSDRRRNSGKELPVFLAGKDRRHGPRRKGFGKKRSQVGG